MDAMSQPSLAPLKHRVYFVAKARHRWEDVFAGATPHPDDVFDRMLDANDTWCVQTYLVLKRLGLDVELVDRFVPGQICCVAYQDLWPRNLPYRSFVVCVRHDRGRPHVCEHTIVQCHLNLENRRDHLIPLWPQPGLLKRDPSRGERLENLVYKGLDIYLAKPFRSPEFARDLAAMGIHLEVTPGDLKNRQANWSDYTEADAVIAVRNVTEYDLSIKPPSKLVNAWFAGTPALLGPEPAYQHLRRSPLDFIEVRTVEQAVDALRRLKSDPTLYRAMVENGFVRARDFTLNALAVVWRDLLAGPVASDYEAWLRQPRIWAHLGRPVLFAVRMVGHRRERQRHAFMVRNGPRLFGPE
jgi:hypothetical protein